MQEFVVFVTALTAIAALIGFGYGIHALRVMRDQPNAKRSGLLLAALNLLEPSVTVAVLGVTFVLLGRNYDSATVVLLSAAIPLTAMLLAPLVNPRAAQPLRGILVMYGVLRWVNTVALWAMGAVALQNSSIGGGAALALMVLFGLSGLVILFVSVGSIASSLDEARVAQKS